MKIVKAEHFHVDGGWDPWSFLKLTTDDGLVGWSEYSEARSRRGLTRVVLDMQELLIGEDPRDFARITMKLRTIMKSAIGGLQSLAIGAFENACLDIAAKALGVPVYALFGGALREPLRDIRPGSPAGVRADHQPDVPARTIKVCDVAAADERQHGCGPLGGRDVVGGGGDHQQVLVNLREVDALPTQADPPAHERSDEKRTQRGKRGCDRESGSSGRREPQEHDVAGHVRNEDVAELDVTYGVHEARHDCE